MSVWSTYQARCSGEGGASLIEYALLVALIAFVALIALQSLGDSVSNQLDNVATCIDNPSLPCSLP